MESELMRQVSDVRQEIGAAEVGASRDLVHSYVSKHDFEREKQRLWDALDTHTHNIDDKKAKPIGYQPASVVEVLTMPTPSPIVSSMPGSVRVAPSSMVSPRQVSSVSVPAGHVMPLNSVMRQHTPRMMEP